MIVTSLPGVSAGGEVLQKEHLEVPVWGGNFTIIFFLAALGSSVPVCRSSSCLSDVFIMVDELYSPVHYLCGCIYVCTWKPEIHINLTEISFSAGAFTPSSPSSEMYA